MPYDFNPTVTGPMTHVQPGFQDGVPQRTPSPYASAQLPGPINIEALYNRQADAIGTGQYSGQTFNQFSPELLNAIALMAYQGGGGQGGAGGQQNRNPGKTQGQGDQGGWDPTKGNQPTRYGSDGNLKTRDTQRTNELVSFQNWWKNNPPEWQAQNPIDSARTRGTYNQYRMGQLAPYIGEGIGSGLGAFSGVPGLGQLGKAAGQAYNNNLYDKYFFMSDGTNGGIYDYWQGAGPNPDPIYSGNDLINNAMNEFNPNDPRTWGGLQNGMVPDRSTRGQNGNWSNPNGSQFITDWNNRWGNTHNSNFDAAGNRVGRSGSMFGDMPEGVRFEGGRPVGADGRAPDAGDLWVTFDYGN